MDPTKNPQQEQQQEEEKFTRDDVQALINSATADVRKRFEAKLEKSLGELKTLLTQQQAPTPKDEPAEDKSGKGGDSKSKLLEQQLADLKRQVDEERTSRLRIEDERRRDTTRGQLRKHLEGANVRPELLDMVLSHWEATGTLKYDDDGKALVTVKRSRTKGAPEEEMTFDDLKQGVEDFVKLPMAAVLIKPPESVQRAQQQGAAQNGVRTFARPAQSEEEATAQLATVLGDSLFINQ